MSLHIRLSGQLAERAGQKVVELPDASPYPCPLPDVFQQLIEAIPALEKALYDEQGVWRVTTLVSIQGEHVRDLEDTGVPDGTEILLLMPMAGG